MPALRSLARPLLAAALAGLAACTPVEDRAPEPLAYTVAHRGVVNDTLPENSLASLEETIRRGYTHVEVDLRATRDGRAICLHDRSLLRTTGIDRNIDELTLAELRGVVGPALVPTLDEFCARIRGRIALMPDVKEVPDPLVDAFAADIEQTLARYGLLESALFIGREEVVDRFPGKARVRWREPYAVVAEKMAAMGPVADNYFVFNHAADFDRAEVEGFHSLGLPVVVSINTFHYTEGDPVAQGMEDVRRMLALGVDGLQIDAVYEPAVPGLGAPAPSTE